MEAWVQVVLAIIALGTAVVALSKQRDHNLWRHIGALQQQIAALRAELAQVRQEARDANTLANDYRLTILAREAEVNDLLEELDRPPKYVLVPLATSGGVGTST